MTDTADGIEINFFLRPGADRKGEYDKQNGKTRRQFFHGLRLLGLNREATDYTPKSAADC
jgi:hypothetical protein